MLVVVVRSSEIGDCIDKVAGLRLNFNSDAIIGANADTLFDIKRLDLFGGDVKEHPFDDSACNGHDPKDTAPPSIGTARECQMVID